MPALAPAYPLYQEGPRPVVMMPRHPGLAPAVCGDVGQGDKCPGRLLWGEANRDSSGVGRRKAPGWDYCGVEPGILTALLVKLMMAKHAGRISLGHKLTILYFCEFVKEHFPLLAQRM
ncbi:hypothetical protein BTVI_89213 [Pitangus sulphuratus]|nr:hypothetical protein BTVI_89213 [Pitangus sulphuratus]